MHNIEEEEDASGDQEARDIQKRKRDSFDNISMISTDSMAAPTTFHSAKKPKLIRTGSITRGIRRSISFVVSKNPISSVLRTRRNSVDPNASISSITSIESTFNESIKKPVKEKMRSLRNRLMKSGQRGDITPKMAKVVAASNLSSFKIIKKFATATSNEEKSPTEKTAGQSQLHNDDSDLTDFKTPLVPIISYRYTPTVGSSNVPQIETKNCCTFATEKSISTARTSSKTQVSPDETKTADIENTVTIVPEQIPVHLNFIIMLKQVYFT